MYAGLAVEYYGNSGPLTSDNSVSSNAVLGMITNGIGAASSASMVTYGVGLLPTPLAPFGGAFMLVGTMSGAVSIAGFGISSAELVFELDISSEISDVLSVGTTSGLSITTYSLLSGETLNNSIENAQKAQALEAYVGGLISVHNAKKFWDFSIAVYDIITSSAKLTDFDDAGEPFVLDFSERNKFKLDLEWEQQTPIEDNPVIDSREEDWIDDWGDERDLDEMDKIEVIELY